MAERANSELFTKNSLKLQTNVFTIQSGIQDITQTIEAKTASVPVLDGDSDVYKGSAIKNYDLEVLNVQVTPIKPFGEWTATISDKTVSYRVSGGLKNTLYTCIANVRLMGETILVLPYNVQAILNGVIIVGDVEYVLVQPHQFNLKNTIIFEDLNNNKIEWSKKDHTTWTTLTDIDLRESSVFLTYLI